MNINSVVSSNVWHSPDGRTATSKSWFSNYFGIREHRIITRDYAFWITIVPRSHRRASEGGHWEEHSVSLWWLSQTGWLIYTCIPCYKTTVLPGKAKRQELLTFQVIYFEQCGTSHLHKVAEMDGIPNVKPMLFERWATTRDAGPPLKPHWIYGSF